MGVSADYETPTITSTEFGGDWFDPFTWEEGRVPDETDSVKIVSTVDTFWADIIVQDIHISSWFWWGWFWWPGWPGGWISQLEANSITVNGDYVVEESIILNELILDGWTGIRTLSGVIPFIVTLNSDINYSWDVSNFNILESNGYTLTHWVWNLTINELPNGWDFFIWWGVSWSTKITIFNDAGGDISTNADVLEISDYYAGGTLSADRVDFNSGFETTLAGGTADARVVNIFNSVLVQDSFQIEGDLNIVNNSNFIILAPLTVNGQLQNLWQMDISAALEVSWNIETNSNVFGGIYLDWDDILWATEYEIFFDDDTSFTTADSRYFIDEIQYLTSWTPYNWYIQARDSGWSLLETQRIRCINVSSCTQIWVDVEYPLPELEIEVPIPFGLTQKYQAPVSNEILTIGTWASIWKFQSGSGVIFWAQITSDAPTDYNLVLELLELPNLNIIQTTSTGFLSDGTSNITSLLSAWDYIWQVKVTDNDWNESEAQAFGWNDLASTDFSIFEWFEPYPFGYKFKNNSPSFTLSETEKKQIFHSAFPKNIFDFDERMISKAYNDIWFNNNNPAIIYWWSCFWMSLTSLWYYENQNEFVNKFPEFIYDINWWNIWDIEEIWNNYSISLETILANQIYQRHPVYHELETDSLENDTPNSILNEIDSNLNSNYILIFYWKRNCIFWFSCSSVWHAVVPYKVEGNKIFFWDNNNPISDVNYDPYNQFIEINSDNTWSLSSYSWDENTSLALIKVSDIYNQWPWLPIWFNESDTLLTLSWNPFVKIVDEFWNISWFTKWWIVQEIPWTKVLIPLNVTSDDIPVENTWKQIYLPQKTQNLKIEISWNTDESYDLLIAWGDYYTKLEWVATSSGQVDSFVSTATNLEINFDDTKDGEYTLLVDNFQDSWTGTVYVDEAEVMPELQNYNIDWTKVVDGADDAVTLEIDSDGDGAYDMTETFPAIPETEEEFDYLITLQNPKYITYDDTTETYTCDPNRKNCKINFGIRKLDGRNLWNKNHICTTDFEFGTTDQDNTCNPRKVVFPSWTHTVVFSAYLKDDPDTVITKQVTVVNPEKDPSFSLELNNNKYLTLDTATNTYTCNPSKNNCFLNLKKYKTPTWESLSKALSCETTYSWWTGSLKCNPPRIEVPVGTHTATINVFETINPANMSEQIITLVRN